MLQEPASVLFSLLNMVAHAVMLRRYKYCVRSVFLKPIDFCVRGPFVCSSRYNSPRDTKMAGSETAMPLTRQGRQLVIILPLMVPFLVLNTSTADCGRGLARSLLSHGCRPPSSIHEMSSECFSGQSFCTLDLPQFRADFSDFGIEKQPSAPLLLQPPSEPTILTTDVPRRRITERLDYFSANAAVLFTFYGSLKRLHFPESPWLATLFAAIYGGYIMLATVRSGLFFGIHRFWEPGFMHTLSHRPVVK